MDAKLITIPAIHWPNFAGLTKKYLGQTPTRKLDEQSIPCDTVEAFVKCLDLMGADSFKLVPVSFLLFDKIQNIHAITRYMECHEEEAEGSVCCIASGPLEHWIDNVVRAGPMPLANAIYMEMYQNGLGIAFRDYTRVKCSDTTFKLKRKE